MTPAGNPNSTSPAVPAASDAGSADLSGQTLGDFKILRRLGQGGMGQVYVAEQISLKRKVALKVLKPELAANATALARFKLEAEAVARATHANIVQVYAIDHVGDIHFMALEYVEGRNLRQYLERKGPPEVLVALSIIRQVAAALQRQRAGHHPPRHQTGKHPADAQDRGQGRRLRPVTLLRRHRPAAPHHAERRHHGHAAVHEP